jgi:hypothetical protein
MKRPVERDWRASSSARAASAWRATTSSVTSLPFSTTPPTSGSSVRSVPMTSIHRQAPRTSTTRTVVRKGAMPPKASSKRRMAASRSSGCSTSTALPLPAAFHPSRRLTDALT